MMIQNATPFLRGDLGSYLVVRGYFLVLGGSFLAVLGVECAGFELGLAAFKADVLTHCLSLWP